MFPLWNSQCQTSHMTSRHFTLATDDGLLQVVLATYAWRQGIVRSRKFQRINRLHLETEDGIYRTDGYIYYTSISTIIFLWFLTLLRPEPMLLPAPKITSHNAVWSWVVIFEGMLQPILWKFSWITWASRRAFCGYVELGWGPCASTSIDMWINKEREFFTVNVFEGCECMKYIYIYN